MQKLWEHLAPQKRFSFPDSKAKWEFLSGFFGHFVEYIVYNGLSWHPLSSFFGHFVERRAKMAFLGRMHCLQWPFLAPAK